MQVNQETVVRWGYKTVFFGLKKDGLLGSAFLDDAEIEEELNEYGRSGWELVSIFETRDGVIAVFKQPLDLPLPERSGAITPQSRQQVNERPRTFRSTAAAVPVIKERVYEPVEEIEKETMDEPAELDDFELEPAYRDGSPGLKTSTLDDLENDEPALFSARNKRKENEDDGDIGAIRIE